MESFCGHIEELKCTMAGFKKVGGTVRGTFTNASTSSEKTEHQLPNQPNWSAILMLSLDWCFIITLFVKHLAPKDTIMSLSAIAVDGVDVGEEHYVNFTQPSWLVDAFAWSAKVPKSHPRSEIW